MTVTINTVLAGDDFPDAWDTLITRLETLRVVGGVPAMRFELMRYDNETLLLIKDTAVKAVTTTGVEDEEQNAAFEIAASIYDVIEHRKGM